jgi:hypothetical protein
MTHLHLSLSLFDLASLLSEGKLKAQIKSFWWNI